jgi:hypothetical protein
MLTYSVVLLHENALLQLLALEHCWSISTGSCLTTLHLVASDYHLCIYMKSWFGSQHFNKSEELMEGVRTWLSSQAAEFSDTGMKELILRYKCLNSSGDYVEK